MSEIVPVQLERTAGGLRIAWSDGVHHDLTLQQLREACPCATCREQRKSPAPPSNMLPVISQAEAQPLGLQGMKPVGNYAYNVVFSDGHDTGIYTFELLRELGSQS